MSTKETMARWRRYVNENQRRAADEHLWEQHVEGHQFSEYARRYANQILAEKLFSLDEKKIDVKKSGLVKDLIAAGKWVSLSQRCRRCSLTIRLVSCRRWTCLNCRAMILVLPLNNFPTHTLIHQRAERAR